MSELDTTISKSTRGFEEQDALLTVDSREVDTTGETRASSRRVIYLVIASLTAAVLLGLGVFHESHYVINASTHLRGLLDLTKEGDPMPVPFFVIRKDVASAWTVQDAFANFYYLKGISSTLDRSNGGSLTVNFFDSIKLTNADGTVTTMGYFNPTSPQGQASNIFNFEYGDKCPATGDYSEGFLELICGPQIAVVSISETDRPCKYKIVAAAPQRCTTNDLHPYLSATSPETTDGQYWMYKINFHKEAHKSSRVFMYHPSNSAGHIERVHLGEIESSLASATDIPFSKGDINPVTKKHNHGVIHIECGCDYGIEKMTEVTPGKYDVVVTHPNACANIPSHCSKTEHQAIKMQKEQLLATVKPGSYKSLGTYPRDLLHPKH